MTSTTTVKFLVRDTEQDGHVAQIWDDRHNAEAAAAELNASWPNGVGPYEVEEDDSGTEWWLD
jgi:hypothetical protein